MKTFVLTVLIIVMGGWVALVLSTHGVLVASSGPIPNRSGGQDTLNCTFFTGLEFVVQTYYYSPDGMMGRVICPRLKDFR